MRGKFSVGGEMISGYANWYKSDGRFVTMNFETPDGANQLILEKNTAAVAIFRNNKWAEQYRFATMSNLNARFMNMSDFTIEKIKSIYDTNIPTVGYINYTSAIAPDGNTGFVLTAGHCAITIQLSVQVLQHLPLRRRKRKPSIVRHAVIDDLTGVEDELQSCF